MWRLTDVFRQALGANKRAVSPVSDDDDGIDESNDSINLDPELQQIRDRVRAEALRKSANPSNDSNASQETVILNVKWQPHPLTAKGKEQIWPFKLGHVRAVSRFIASYYT